MAATEKLELKEMTDAKEDQPQTPAQKLEALLLCMKEKNEEGALELVRSERGLLHEACFQQNLEAVTVLLDLGVSSADWNKAFLLPLHIAAKNNAQSIARKLLDHNRDGVDRPSKFGETPLHFACMQGHFDMVKLLIGFRADVRCIDRVGNTTLHYAVSSNNPTLVHWLLKETELRSYINKRNHFQHSPVHRAALLQCVEVMQVLHTFRARFNYRDKNGLTALDIATLLHNNERVTTPLHGEPQTDHIIPKGTGHYLSPSPSVEHIRSSSFSTSRGSMDSSTFSLGGGLPRKRSATQTKRPVNLTFSNPAFSRQLSNPQASHNDIDGSHSSLYLKDREQATRLSVTISQRTSGNFDDMQRIVLEETCYEPPTEMTFVEPIDKFSLKLDEPKHQCKEHDIRIRVKEQYWRKDSSEVLECCIAAGLHWNHAFPPGYVFVSPICFISCKAQRACEAKLTLPHALQGPPEDMEHRIAIFSSATIPQEVGSQLSSPSPSTRSFQRVVTTSLSLEPTQVVFETNIKYPVLFAVGVAVAPIVKGKVTNALYPFSPLRCCLYVACPADRDKYLSTTDIEVYVAMGVKTVNRAMQQSVITNEYQLQEKTFTYQGHFGPALKLEGMLENDEKDWQISRRGTGFIRYNQIVLSQEVESDTLLSHRETYPPRESFFIECNNPMKALKCRITASMDKDPLLSILVTPYTPIKTFPQLSLALVHKERTPTPTDLEDSTESSSPLAPMQSSSV